MKLWMPAFLFAAGCFLPHAPCCAETWQIRVEGGKVYAGEVDVRTDDRLLWLRWNEGAMLLRRSFPWRRINRIVAGDNVIPADQWQQRAQAGKSAPAEPAPLVQPRVVAADRPEPPKPIVVEHGLAWATAVSLPVSSLHIDAALGNWNRSVEADGVVLWLYPRDAWGRLVPVRGTLDVEILGMGPDEGGEFARFPRIVRTSVAISPEQFTAAGAVCQIAFQAVHPEFNLDLRAEGVVHARLIVPGHGVFEASADTRLRRYSPLRDQLQLQTGRRFFAGEYTEGRR